GRTGYLLRTSWILSSNIDSEGKGREIRDPAKILGGSYGWRELTVFLIHSPEVRFIIQEEASR
ncbi:hypothetical protein AVEN_55443-1, partial [Araneus ventricosus]